MEFTIETILKVVLLLVALVGFILLINLISGGSLNIFDRLLGFIR